MFKVSFVDKLLFTQHLSLMIKAGLSLREGVLTIKEQTHSSRFRRILENTIKHLDNGESLADSLAVYPRDFDDLFVSIIRIGEASGSLDKNLEYLSNQLEKSQGLKRKVIAAMIYPAIVLLATFGLGAALSFFVLPKLIPFFKTLKVELPLSTKILLWLAQEIQTYGIFIISAIIAFLTFFFLISRLKPIKAINHAVILRLPIIGKIIRHFNLAIFSRTLGMLIKSGLPIVQALDIAAKSLSNLSFQDHIKNISLRVQKGEQMSVYLKKGSVLFPAIFSRMVEIGEKTGTLEQTLFYLADFYEKEVDNSTEKLSTILEPVLLIIIGLVVGFIAVSIITPIYQVTKGLEQ